MDTKQLIEEIYAAAYEVRQHLYAGYLESVYQNALIIELRNRGFMVAAEVPITVQYKGHTVGTFRADIIVNNEVILELKSVRELQPIHEAQLVNYLLATGINHGVVINYGDNYAFRYKTRDYRRFS
ncbi:MAG: GxxExxY protein [Muribaculaceae bacterium]|nr:GxxExxY protein [Bacteroides sp.]MDE6263315.1 GxxExxY protein [Muribaculaceae bacterium]